MARVFRLNSTIKSVGEQEDGQLKIVGYASTADTDRVGDVIVPDAWLKSGGLDNFKNNPVILFNHNYSVPIGKATEVEVDSTGLKVTCLISDAAGPTKGLIKDGVLSTFSVGFMIKDADYSEATDGYIIRDAELLEVSVVSIPCNAKATFSIKKSLQSDDELHKFEEEVNISRGQDPNEVNTSEVVPLPESGTVVPPEKKSMTPEEIAAMVAEATQKALADQRAAAEKAAKEAAEKKAAEEAAAASAKAAAEAAVKSTEERLLADFDAKLKENNENFEKTFNEMKTALEEKAQDLENMRSSKRNLIDSKSSNPLENNELMTEAENAFVLAKMLKKGFDDTKLGKEVLEKFNTHSTVSVGSDALERTVSTNIERDIWNELILAPMFREIGMNSAEMTFPIMPDAGYAEITAATTAAGNQPNGNMDQRGAGYGAPYQGLTLSERTLRTVKMIARSYLGNETEEDAILPVLPLIKESMARSHARGVENMLLAGNTDQGVYTSGAANGLIRFAQTGGRTLTTSAADTKLTAAALFGMRKLMGKYGRDPRDLVYVVSQQAWFELIEDPEFMDADLVGANNATKLTGSVGRLYGTEVVMCDEFAPPGAGNYFALALNRRNFLVPRLRGMTVESEYSVDKQHTVLVSSQRLGFDEIIPGAPAIVGLKYADA